MLLLVIISGLDYIISEHIGIRLEWIILYENILYRLEWFGLYYIRTYYIRVDWIILCQINYSGFD